MGAVDNVECSFQLDDLAAFALHGNQRGVLAEVDGGLRGLEAMDPEVDEPLLTGCGGTDILIDAFGAGHEPLDGLAGRKTLDDVVDSSAFLGVADEVLKSDHVTVDAQVRFDV